MEVNYNNFILPEMLTEFHIFLLLKWSFVNLKADEKVDDNIDLARLADLTEGFSGSDLREVCRTAAVYRMRELVKLFKLLIENICSKTCVVLCPKTAAA
jgi:SpoVK/Ycf46/Vps4 family AAA+-type ATPase